MPEPPPKGIFPFFLRGVTCEKYGMKTGEGVNDLVTHISIPREEVLKEIQGLGVMSDFEPAKKHIDGYGGEDLLIVVDLDQKYGETFLLCYTDEAKDEYLNEINKADEELKAKILAEQKEEEERQAAEFARLNQVYEDKPLSPRLWSSTTAADTDNEIKLCSHPSRETLAVEISRPKRFTKLQVKFSDRNADVGGIAEFRAYKDPNFKVIRENDIAIQVAPESSDSSAQTTWYRSVSKAVQYTPARSVTEPLEGESKEALLVFLENATISIENALQQNECVDIFNETFRLLGDDEAMEGNQADNELREIKNFADPNYSKFKVLSAIDWMPKAQGMVAVSAVRNISFDQRVAISGQTFPSYVLLWDFRLLVKPLILMQAQHEIFTFRFNKFDTGIIAGGCITGQVVLWDIYEAMSVAQRKNNRGPSGSSSSAAMEQDDDELSSMPVQPKFVSNVDQSHKKCVSDLFWLPPTTQINYRGQLVGEEHLDGHSYQFVTVAGDGMVLVWDIRYKQIFNDELRHIGRAKHIPTEKSSNKEGGNVKPLWGPIFRAHLKRLEGVGELSLCRICDLANPKESSLVISKQANLPGDTRSQFMIATEEGDIIFTDLSARRGESNKEDDEDDDGETAREFVKWIAADHARPSVALQESPFFPQIMLSVSDWNFHLWKLGEDKPLFVSPLSTTYLTAGAWSTTRPAVLYVACADGQLLVWDFTDSSFRPSIELKATHSKITSMEFLPSATAGSRLQLLACGDEVGTLHIFEVPRNLTRPVHKEDSVMLKFLDREIQRVEAAKEIINAGEGGGARDGAEIEEAQGGRYIETEVDFRGGGGTTGGANTVGMGDHGGGDGGDGGTLSDEAMNAEKERLAKEEEEFLKLEASFIEELGLTEDTLPVFVKN